MKRAGMDYLSMLDLVRHTSWDAFREVPGGRLVLLTTAGDVSHADFAFRPDDRIIVGCESAGVPIEVHQGVDARIRIPMASGNESLNAAAAAAVLFYEAARQRNASAAANIQRSGTVGPGDSPAPSDFPKNDE